MTDLSDIVRGARVVAVVGIKGDQDAHAAAHSVPAAMQAHGIRIIPINPTIGSALGVPALKSIAELHERVDVLQIFRRAEALPGIADEVLALPPSLCPKTVWMQLGIVSEAAATKLRAAGIEVVMDRCFAVEMAKAKLTSA